MTSKAGGTAKSAKNGGVVQEQGEAKAAPDSAETGLKPLELPAALAIHDLAALMEADPVDVIKELMRGGHMLTINEVVEHEFAALITPAFGFQVLPLAKREESGSQVISPDEEDAELLETRPPVVTILGHVDHGKTTLLDAIRSSEIVAGEAGGITQHIGAYQVEFNGTPISFLDTPGHEAFTAMRARGTRVTDIAILVVAADDGIMPQTVEAIDHARAADVPVLVAINKVDRPEADVERVKRQLSENNLLIEEWGGDVIAVNVSALKGGGVTELLENILVVAEVAELKANPNRQARGVVVEARVDSKRGTVATVLVQTGTLELGDNIVAGNVRGRVKAMITDRGAKVESAGPSRPVEILGLNGMPEAGDTITVAPDEKTARQMVEEQQESLSRRGGGPTLEDVHTRMESGESKALNLIIKTDVQGTVDAVRSSLERLSTEQTRVNIIHAASGSITESDVLLSVASEAIIIGFNSRPEPGAAVRANKEGVEIRFYDVIYGLIDDVDKALQGLIEPEIEDIVEGLATVRAIFGVGKRANAAGIFVSEGRIARDSTVHLLRNGVELFAGRVTSLKHFKNDVGEVTANLEGGIVLEGFNDFQEGDTLEAHRSERGG